MLIAFLLLMETSFIGSARPVILRLMFICTLSTNAKDFGFSSFICTSIARLVSVLEIRNMLDPLNLPEVVTIYESFRERGHNFRCFETE